MATTCDPKSYELAEHFLQDEPRPELTPAQHEARTKGLALEIQQTIEDWLESERIDRARQALEQDARDEELRSLRRYTDEERERI